jgi:beta-ribofuranosylaminobenzene 5'-phosphate synthase
MNESPTYTDSADGDQGVAVKVSTGARLHFGLLCVVSPFGGVGVMVDQPATEIVVQPARSFRCDEDPDDRIKLIAGRIAKASGQTELPRCRVNLVARPAAHSGLGSGTQLAMSAAEALCRFVDYRCDQVDLARQIAHRGERSAVGVHGYFSGGLIYESGQQGCLLNPIRQRVDMPAQWCVALFRPPQSSTPVSGEREREQFAKLTETGADLRDELAFIVQQQIVSAAQVGDFDAFASAVSSYNYQSGLLFASVQGGAYNGQAVAGLVNSLVDRGAQGVGQSSWGPSVFAWFRTIREAREFSGKLPRELPPPLFAHPLNRGRMFSQSV